MRNKGYIVSLFVFMVFIAVFLVAVTNLKAHSMKQETGYDTISMMKVARISHNIEAVWESYEPADEGECNDLEDDAEGILDGTVNVDIGCGGYTGGGDPPAVSTYQDCDNYYGPTPAGCEAAPCTDGDTKDCDTGESGICADGTQTCSGGSWGICVRDNGPETEDCDNGKDDDCDGDKDCEDTDCSLDPECDACIDGDDDGYNLSGPGCGPPDCDDSNPNIHPENTNPHCDCVEPTGEPLADESGHCDDGLDNDCDGDDDCGDDDCEGDPACSCSDGTPLGACSSMKPYYCDPDGTLKSDCSQCGCPGLSTCKASGSCGYWTADTHAAECDDGYAMTNYDCTGGCSSSNSKAYCKTIPAGVDFGSSYDTNYAHSETCNSGYIAIGFNCKNNGCEDDDMRLKCREVEGELSDGTWTSDTPDEHSCNNGFIDGFDCTGGCNGDNMKIHCITEIENL